MIFKKRFSLRMLFTFFKLFQNLSHYSLLDRSNLKSFSFSTSNLQGFFSSSACKSLLPFLFQFIHTFHAFSLKFLNSWFLGFLNFGLFLFTFDHWVFVFRWYKHDPHALIWSILWIWKILKFLGLKLCEIEDFVQLGLNW